MGTNVHASQQSTTEKTNVGSVGDMVNEAQK